MHNTFHSIKYTKLNNAVTFLLLFIIIFVTIGLFLVSLGLAKIGTITQCDEDTNCISTSCVMKSCINGECVEATQDGCFNVNDTTINNNNTIRINDHNLNYDMNANSNNDISYYVNRNDHYETAYALKTLYSTNFTSSNYSDSINSQLTVGGVEFVNDTIYFNCLIGNNTDCDYEYQNVFILTRLLIREFLTNNGFNITLVNNTIIFSNGTMQLYNATITFKKLFVLDQICIDDMVNCINETGITIKNITFTNEGMEIPTLNITGNITTINATIQLQTTFNLSSFLIENGTVQAYQNTSFIDAFYNPEQGKIGIGFRDPLDVEYDVHVNGNTRADSICFNNCTSGNTEDFELSTFTYTTIRPSFYGPWKLNISSTIVLNRFGKKVLVFFPEEVQQFTYKNSTIYSSLKIPEGYRPNVESDSDYVESRIIVFCDVANAPEYSGNVGRVRVFGDGTLEIWNTELTTQSSNSTTLVGITAPFYKNTVSGFFASSISYNVM
jgi:hypothetical protein